MITKTKLKETIDKFPEEITIDELIEKIVIMDKIDRGNKQSEKGETISEEDLDKEMSKWFR